MDVSAMTLFPFIFMHPDDDEHLVRHESIHIEQQKELWLIGFYILYVYYFMRLYIKHRNWSAAYLRIPFEREAYSYQYVVNYLEKREKHAWKGFRGDSKPE